MTYKVSGRREPAREGESGNLEPALLTTGSVERVMAARHPHTMGSSRVSFHWRARALHH